MGIRSRLTPHLARIAASRTARNLGWLGVTTAAIKPIWFAYITLVCMRLLGAEGYGVFSSALAFAVVAASFSDLGTSELTTRNVARDNRLAGFYLSNLLPLRILLAGGALVLAIGAGSFVSQHDSLSVLAAAGFYGIAFRALEFCRAFFRAIEVHRLEALSMFLEKGLVVMLGTSALLLSPSPAAVTWAMALGMALTLSATLFYIHRRIARLKLSTIRASTALDMLRQGLPIGVFGLASLAALHSPTVLLESMQGAASAGEYAAAFRVVEALQFLPAIVAAILLPRLSSLSLSGYGVRFRSTTMAFIGIVVAVTSIIALSIAIVAPELISILSGRSDFQESAGLLRVMIWGLPMMAGSLLVATSLLSMDDQVTLAILVSVLSVASIVAQAFAIATASTSGAAFTFTVTHVVMLVALVIRYRLVLRRLPGGSEESI